MILSDNAITVLKKRYLAKDEEGKLIEDVEGLFRRVAKTIADVDRMYDAAAEVNLVEQEFYELMTGLEFLPNSPTLMNAGRPLGQLSACFVLPIEDSMSAIFDSIKHAALIHKSGGGTGFSFSRLRPKGSTVGSTGGVASGPVSFMKVFNAATEAVKQGGTRRGANMGILRVDHPDIIEFITCKKDNSDINNFNISVGITEEFMEAVEKDADYNLIDPNKGQPVGTLRAREIFDMIVEMAWTNGEPGIIFLDRLNKDNVTPELGEIESTNPCGEQPLLPYEACNLGSINLSIMVKENDGVKEVDYERLAGVVSKSVHFLDNVIDANVYPLREITEMTRGTRKIGLGVMGWADLLCKLGISYNTQKAVNLAENLMHFIQEESRKTSIEIAKKRGTFTYFDKSIYKDLGVQVRNATTTTIAPTGTLSIIAGVSSGIEPLFGISYIRNVMDNDELIEVNPLFKEIALEKGFYSESLMRDVALKGTIKEFDEIPEEVRNVFLTAHDISPEWHVKMQAAFQKYTDNAVSKTVNLRNESTMDDVSLVFKQAYKQYCKGVTIYRDGSRDLQVLNIHKVAGKDKEHPEDMQTSYTKVSPRNRPDITTGFTEKVRIGCGNLYITVNYDDNGICEVFTSLGRGGGCPSQSEAASRLVSIALRSGIEVQSIIDQLKGIRCHSTIKQRDLKVLSCPDAIARTIEKVMKLQNAREEASCSEIKPAAKIENNASGESSSKKCPECGELIEHEGGCHICRNCGFSMCS